jgi:hypothetical protein
VTRPVNASDGDLDGFELGFLYFPETLPWYLTGFGVQELLGALAEIGA